MIDDSCPVYLERDPDQGIRTRSVTGREEGRTLRPGSLVLVRIGRVTMVETASTGKVVASAKAAKRSLAAPKSGS
jgi:hypothetical protein